ncbi:MAG: hypothetical protein BMS9Abin36_0662 [Gammaproteobacteria bacterium]|nr:MAG: hypothetical protein BMS9Abin36_0662 [Gammaproteobacteria bacterium]
MSYWLRSFLLAVALTGVLGCTGDNDSRQIEKALAAMEGALEQYDAGELLSYLTVDFQNQEGLDKKGIQRMLAFYRIRDPKLEVLISGIKISVSRPGANTRFRVLLLGGPRRGRNFNVEMDWRHVDGGWQVRRMRWSKS